MLSRRITYYIKALSERFDISLLCLKDSQRPHVERYEKARLLRIPLKQGTLQCRIEQFERAVRRQLQSEEYVVAHCFDFVSGRILAELKKQLGYQLVCEASTLHSHEWPHFQPEDALSPATLKKIETEKAYAAEHANALIVATEQQKRWLLNAGQKLPVHVLYTPSLPRAETFAHPTAYFQFLHLGGETQLPALLTTLHALNTIPLELKIQLALGGYYSAKNKTLLASLKNTLHAKDIVSWPSLKHKTDFKTLCARADAALLPLEAEPRNVGFGSPMPELADFCSWGLPIVAADLPCVREFLGPDDALFFSPGDSAMLAQRMQELAASHKLQTHLAAASLSKADVFLPSKFMEETSRLYNQWVAKVPPSPEFFSSLPPELSPSSIAPTASHLSSPSASHEPDTVLLPPASPSPE